MARGPRRTFPLVPGSAVDPETGKLDLAAPQDFDLPVDSVSEEERVAKLASILADPQDFRGDEQLASDLMIPLRTVRKLKSDPRFMEPVIQGFRRNIASIAPDIVKALFRQAKGGSLGASRLLLETSGMVQGKTTNVFIAGGGGSQSHDAISAMSDEELDRETHRLLMDTFPDDVAYGSGRMRPYGRDSKNVIEAEVVSENAESAPSRRDD